MRIRVEDDSLVIDGQTELPGGQADSHGDHRIAMAFSVLGLVTPGMTIEDPGCVAKSWPGFWEALRGAGLL